jgi:hypothetical protein
LAVTTPLPEASADSTVALPADQLDDDVDVGRGRQRDRIVEPMEPGEIDAALTPTLACADRRDDDRPAAAHGDVVGARGEDADH